MVPFFVLITSFFLFASASPHTPRAGEVVLESLSSIPAGFTDAGRADSDEELELYIALRESNLGKLVDTINEVSNPNGPSFGKYLLQQDVLQYFKPSQQTVSQVESWLNGIGIASNKIGRAFSGTAFKISIPVSKADQLLNTEFHTYTYTTTEGDTYENVATLGYSVPKDLAEHIDFIHPTIYFPHYRAGDDGADEIELNPDLQEAACGPDGVTPHCVQELYGVPKALATQNSNRLGVIGANDEYANEADLKNFLQKFRPDLNSETGFITKRVANGKNLQDLDQAGNEANLDIQYTVGIASGVPTTFLTVGGNDLIWITDLRWISDLLNMKDIPNVITTSYGADELPRWVTPRQAQKLCNAYIALGARGVSVISASGDHGVAGASGDDCTEFVPAYPSCPYITIVGATSLEKSPGSESLVEIGAEFSAGGFSNYFSAPEYQQASVSSYVSSLGEKYKGKFNPNGRGIPDVAAIGTNIAIHSRGQLGTVNGASASAPIFASVIALINDARVAANKPPLGFLNPFLYKYSETIFNDITKGNNPGCGTEGFSATKGWDPVTGLGTPKFEALKEAALRL
ncbi:hypothetical protein NM688_g6943 [Phlebia brevispora]|uniref:Uncharacterized protein n=1 Tax=Phlebia brevispora TaxID=194682 RepID=A0ACC1SAW2_9APHY|nr:hypothetical protein NM688_g6943 [Phlebia brevispora]